MKIKLSLHLLIIVFVIPIISCNSQECRFCKANQQGAIYQNIRCEADSSVFYNLYVPKGTHDTKLPVLILLDAHGKTGPVVKSYMALAEKYKIILTGFDASANEIPFDIIWGKFRPWLSELNRKAPIDSTLVFIAGFSGGARVTSMIEDKMPQIAATALCGAGPANLSAWMHHLQPVMLFTGTGDFNFLELSSIYGSDKIKRQSSLQIFQGNHEWPPANAFEDFFVLIQRISSGSASAADESFFNNRSRQYLNVGRPDLAVYSASNAVYAGGESKFPKLQIMIDSINNNISPAFIQEYNTLMKKEIVLQQKIQQLFQTADSTLYFSFVDSLNETMQSDSLSLWIDLSNRLKSYCGIVSYSFCNQANKTKSPVLYSLLKMYEYTEPDNVELLILFSTWYASMNECVKANIYLNRAKKQGFTDIKRLQSMKEFDNCGNMLDR